MSRVGKEPISLPTGVEVTADGAALTVKGKRGELSMIVHESVAAELANNVLTMKLRDDKARTTAMVGTMRALANNMVRGVSEGYVKKLQLVGVGYRAQVKGDVLNLTLGFSHPVNFQVPEGLTIETPTPTEVVVSGIDKQKVGQAAAQIRAYRPPEPYKGKGVKYADERIVRKEAKKK